MTSLTRIALLLAGLAAGAAHSQPAASEGNTAYRCANGTYSSTPCPGGTQLDVADPRTPAQQQQAKDAAAREDRLAKQLAAERRLREKETAAPRAVNLGPDTAKPPPPAASKPAAKGKKPHKKPEARVATSGQSTKTSKTTKPPKATQAVPAEKTNR